MTSYVDWELAKSTGRTLAPAGPSLSREEATGEVEAIRAAAAAAYQPVAETSRMQTPPGAPAAVVVDRARWVEANADSMAALLDPAFDQLMSGKGDAARPAPAVAAVGGKVAGAEAGALLAFLSNKVLGQYDLAPQGTPVLMLVAPNIVHVTRELDVDPADFRAWVCMHEETHRVQFTAVPWLRDHLIEGARSLATDLTPSPERLQELTRTLGQRLPELFRDGSAGLTDLFATEEQRTRIAQITAVMSLLEGHADVVMDDVGPAHIPTVATIRERFTVRRKGAGALDKVLRRLLGLEAKMRQYRDGASFVRGVQEKVGVDGFNAVWTSPETLPRPEEIADPAAWVARVHG